MSWYTGIILANHRKYTTNLQGKQRKNTGITPGIYRESTMSTHGKQIEHRDNTVQTQGVQNEHTGHKTYFKAIFSCSTFIG